jgi:hypothetical protein
MDWDLTAVTSCQSWRHQSRNREENYGHFLAAGRVGLKLYKRNTWVAVFHRRRSFMVR